MRDVNKIKKLYMKSIWKYIDTLSILPIDYIYEISFLSIKPIFRFNRLIRIDRIIMFINGTETRYIKRFSK